MGFSLSLAVRYLASRRRSFVSVSTVFAVAGVALGTASLVAVMSVTGGFLAEFRDKVLGVNAHVLVMRLSSEFRNYREVLKQVETLPEVVGAEPFVINPMMVTHRGRTATGVSLKGIDPHRVGAVLDLPRQLVRGSLQGLGAGTSERARSLRQPLSRLEITEPLATGDGGGLELGKGDLPPGSIVPAGGYTSTLPDDDFVPPELQSDPCDSSRDSLPGIVIGTGLAQVLAAGLGDCIQVTSPTIGYSYYRGALRAPVAKQFRVDAVFEAGFEQYDSGFVFTDLREAQAYHHGEDTVTGVEMKIRDIDRAGEVSAQVEKLLRSGLYDVVDWQELNRGLFTALRMQQILMSAVLGLIVVVAAFTVIATLIMLVLEKRRDIAVIKAMGATDSELMRVFLYQGLMIAGVGTALGLMFGYFLCESILARGVQLDPKVSFISTLPVRIRLGEFVGTGAFALIVCFLATLWPAFHASRLRPAEAFRQS